MIGWGGGCCGDASADGAAYDPATNTWRKLPRSPLAPEQSPIGAWTGHELILLVSGIDLGKLEPLPERFAFAVDEHVLLDAQLHRAAEARHRAHRQDEEDEDDVADDEGVEDAREEEVKARDLERAPDTEEATRS